MSAPDNPYDAMTSKPRDRKALKAAERAGVYIPPPAGTVQPPDLEVVSIRADGWTVSAPPASWPVDQWSDLQRKNHDALMVHIAEQQKLVEGSRAYAERLAELMVVAHDRDDRFFARVWFRVRQAALGAPANFALGGVYLVAGASTGVDLFAVPSTLHLMLGVWHQIRGMHLVRSPGVPRRARSHAFAAWVAEHHPRVRAAQRKQADQMIRASLGREQARVRLEAVEAAEVERGEQRQRVRDDKRARRVAEQLSWEGEALEADGGWVLKPIADGGIIYTTWPGAQNRINAEARIGRAVCGCRRFNTRHGWADHARG